MGSASKAKKPSNKSSLAPKGAKPKFKKKKSNNKTKNPNTENKNNEINTTKVQHASASEKLSFFLIQFESANGVQLSSLELESIKESCILELSNNFDQDAKCLGKHIKEAFGTKWKEELCEGQLFEGKVDPGCPAVLIISTSALRSIELLRGLRSMTKECHAVKLFSKHMKVEEQVSLLKNRVNFASGTPSRIKKLIDIEALGLSRLAVVVLDMQTDLKGYSLFTLPQVRDEFWDLYKNYFHQRMLQGNLQICLYGPIPNDNKLKVPFKIEVKREQKQQHLLHNTHYHFGGVTTKTKLSRS